MHMRSGVAAGFGTKRRERESTRTCVRLLTGISIDGQGGLDASFCTSNWSSCTRRIWMSHATLGSCTRHAILLSVVKRSQVRSRLGGALGGGASAGHTEYIRRTTGRVGRLTPDIKITAMLKLSICTAVAIALAASASALPERRALPSGTVTCGSARYSVSQVVAAVDQGFTDFEEGREVGESKRLG